MKKRLILILNGKGGVGKSFFAVNFVQYLKDRQIAHAAFDSDDENSTSNASIRKSVSLTPAQPTEIDRMVTFGRQRYGRGGLPRRFNPHFPQLFRGDTAAYHT